MDLRFTSATNKILIISVLANFKALALCKYSQNLLARNAKNETTKVAPIPDIQGLFKKTSILSKVIPLSFYKNLIIQPKVSLKMVLILDACCGSRMF